MDDLLFRIRLERLVTQREIYIAKYDGDKRCCAYWLGEVAKGLEALQNEYESSPRGPQYSFVNGPIVHLPMNEEQAAVVDVVCATMPEVKIGQVWEYTEAVPPVRCMVLCPDTSMGSLDSWVMQEVDNPQAKHRYMHKGSRLSGMWKYVMDAYEMANREDL